MSEDSDPNDMLAFDTLPAVVREVLRNARHEIYVPHVVNRWKRIGRKKFTKQGRTINAANSMATRLRSLDEKTPWLKVV